MFLAFRSLATTAFKVVASECKDILAKEAVQYVLNNAQDLLNWVNEQVGKLMRAVGLLVETEVDFLVESVGEHVEGKRAARYTVGEKRRAGIFERQLAKEQFKNVRYLNRTDAKFKRMNRESRIFPLPKTRLGYLLHGGGTEALA